MDHDRLFKELLSTFFIEFLELFFPWVLKYLDRDSVEFLDKELFTDVTSGERHEVDLVTKARFKGQDTHFLVHVETQASASVDFPRRMFSYFARLHEKHALPVYPIAMLSFDKPLRAEPHRYQVAFPDTTVLRFQYKTIQLNRLNWRQFARKANPVASALMARMRIAEKDRPKVKLQCIRLLATLRLDPARMQLISGFVDSYLELSPAEQVRLEQELTMLKAPEKEAVSEVLNEWEKRGMHRGIEKGIQKGQEQIVLRLLRRRFSAVPNELAKKIRALPAAKLEELADALLDFSAVADAEAWVASHK